MSISPPSDIVFDVVQAADPAQYRASVEKLRNMRSITSNIEQFSSLIESKRSNSRNVFTQSPSPTKEVNKQFEAFILQNFVQSMFTTNTASVFGKGQSGEIWKSLLIEMVAKEMAQAGGIGIASLLADEQDNLKSDDTG